MNAKLLYFLLFAWFLSSCGKEQVDTIIYNAQIYTVDSSFSQVSAMAIKDGKILETGDDATIIHKYKGKNELDMKGKTVIPGIIDAHCHFSGFAMDKWKLDIKDTKSFEDILEKIKIYAQDAPREWIYARGWDQNLWSVKEFPTKEKLDILFPDRPVYLKRVDGHAALANQKALDIAGINAESKMNGGLVEVKNGKMTGILIDNAMNLVEAKIPPIEDSLTLGYMLKMQEECIAQGLTGVHDCGIATETLQLLKQLDDEDKLRLNVFAILSDDSTYYDDWISKGRQRWKRLQFGGFKIYMDGALGSRGAALIEDYTDKPGWKGFLLKDTNDLLYLSQKIINTDLQLCTHAIGDFGNRKALEIYASVLKNKNNKRWRIEHAQVVNENDFHFFKDYNIIPSVQPTHATSDGHWAGTRLGNERMKNAYAYKKLLQQNNWLPLGTDFPVEAINPFYTFVAAVFRVDKNQQPIGGFQMQDALTREEALRGMTIWAARSSFDENNYGSLEKGKQADFVVLDYDIMTADVGTILNTKVSQTWISGKQYYAK